MTECVWTALEDVRDPCSVLNGTHLSFVELGMVDGVTVQGGHVRLRLLLDDPVCLYVGPIDQQMRDATLAVPGVQSVEIEFCAHEIWTEERATEEARAKLGGLRERARVRRSALTGAPTRPGA